MINLTRPSFLVPFALVTPYLFLGGVGITWFELLILGTLFLHFVVMGQPIPTKNIIASYVVLLLAGYGMAVMNGALNFGVPIGLQDLKVFYWLLLAYAGFYIGYRHYQPLPQIATALPIRMITVILCVFVLAYPFLAPDVRMLIMRPFYSPESDPSQLLRLRFEGPRFPGFGVNANIFAFMTLVVYLLMFRECIAKRVKWIYPALLGLSLTVMGSKTVFLLAALLSLHLMFFSSISTRNKLYLAAGAALAAFATFFFLFFTEQGEALQDSIVIIDRLMQLTEARDMREDSPFDIRLDTWQRGMERVELAPIAGIQLTNAYDDGTLLNFCCPHNEFIAFWTFTGFLGLLANVVLIGYLIKRNLFAANWAFWIGLYAALCVQMFFDAAFQSPRFIPFMFMLFGLNLRELDRPGSKGVARVRS